MTINPYDIEELVLHTESLRGVVLKNLKNPHAWNHSVLSRFYGDMTRLQNRNLEAVEFATLFSITTVLLYLQVSFFEKDAIIDGVDGWFIIHFNLEISIESIKSKATQPLEKHKRLFIALLTTMQGVTIPNSFKSSIVLMGQIFKTKPVKPAIDDYYRMLPLLGDYLIHFYPDLKGNPSLFINPPTPISFIVGSFDLLISSRVKKSRDIDYPNDSLYYQIPLLEQFYDQCDHQCIQ